MVDLKDLYSNILSGLHTEPPDDTMKKKLIINVAPTGSFTNRQQNPYQPYTMEENVTAAVEACRAGAAVWHVHTREADGLPSREPAIVKETIDRVFEKCPDIVTSVLTYTDFTQQGSGHLRPCVEYLLEKGGPRHIQTTPLNVAAGAYEDKYVRILTRDIFAETIGYLEQCGVRPEYQCDNYGSIRQVEDWLIKTGVSRTPALMNIMAGFHGRDFASPAAGDPWKYAYLMSVFKAMPGDTVQGVCAGGRNWLPFTVFAIMLGVDVVRVGMEDSIFVHPHRDEMLKTSAEAVKIVADIARALGRDIATPDEAREIMGITSIAAAESAAAE